MAKAKDLFTEADAETQAKDQIIAAEVADAKMESVQISSEGGVTETAAEDQPSDALAKAGKRSAKAQAEAAEKSAKEERKLLTEEEQAALADRPKQKSNPTRTRLERQGKKFRDAAAKIEVGKVYSLKEAVALARQTSPVKFDASVEVHVNLSVDPRHADQNIRDNLVLPAGTGKTVRVAVFADEAAEGADLQGVETITQQLDKGEMNFDILIATPTNMPKLGKYARALGPRGLMPNPKSGTVTTDVAKAVREAKAGRVEYRVDSTGIVHLGVGKVSFDEAKLLQNVQAVLTSIKGNKPASVKGNYVKAVYVSTSMGPSIPVATSEV